MQRRTRWRGIVAALALLVAACGGSPDDPTSAGADETVQKETTDEASDADTNTGADTTGAEDDASSEIDEAADTTDEADGSADADEEPTSTDDPDDSADTSEAAPSSALQVDGTNVMIAWDDLPSTPFYAGATQASDPFFHIHTNPDSDGFFFSLELYPEWGQAWTGEVGTFEISCSDPATSTGICPYLDPDGPGPLPVLGDDFATTGTITINILDAGGYNLDVGPIVFSDGTEIAPFTMVG